MIQFIPMTMQERTHCGWILYTEEECARNRYYIELYRKACDKYGLSIKLGIYKPPQTWNGAARAQLAALTADAVRPAFAINRTRDYRLAAELEKLGIRVYNHSRIAELGNDKAKACRLMEQYGIPMMPTIYGIRTPPWYPAIIKSCGGHGGTEVYFIPHRQALEDWKRSAYQPQKDYLMQQAASDLGLDVRAYAVGNQITACILRSNNQDFRSNFCLGGTVRQYKLNQKEHALAQRILSILTEACNSPFPIGMAGIDFIFHHGEPVFNEIEDMAGARSLYSLSNYDIVDAYIKFIKLNDETAECP